MHVNVFRLLLCSISVIVFSGCAKGPERPEFNASQCAADALAAYDSDGDGFLSKEEYTMSPGLLAASARVDSDGNGLISKEEIENRVDYYRNATTYVVSGGIRVVRKGRGLADATVTFEPESFLGEEFKPCSGTTDQLGETSISRETAEFPGIYLGMYRVRVSKIVNGKETIPAKYNTETTLGFESATDLPEVSDVVTFTLK